MSVRVHVSLPRPPHSGPALKRSIAPESLAGTAEHAVHAVFAAERRDAGELSITFLDDPGIADLNHRYLGHDRPTDVIAFPLHDPDDSPVGDVYIGLDQALRQAADLDVDPAEELTRLVIHGTLHVLGYDHAAGPEREQGAMWRHQEEILARALERARP